MKGAWQVFDLGASVDSHPSDACILAKINGQRKCAVWQTVHWCLALLDGMGPRDARNIRTKEMNAHARTMAAAHRSTIATFRNIGRPYHRKAQGRRLRYVLKYLHLVANSKRQTAPNSEGRLLLRNPPHIELQTIGHGEQHLTPQSILYCNYRQSVINSLFLTTIKCN